MFMRYILMFVCMVIVNSTALANRPIVSTKTLMFDVLNPFFSETIENGKRVIQYCPELPCEIIKVGTSVDIDIVYDYVLLFYMFDTSYLEFKESDYKMPSGYIPYIEFNKRVPPILNRYKSVCQSSSGEIKPSCVLEFLKGNFFFTSRLIVEKW